MYAQQILICRYGRVGKGSNVAIPALSMTMPSKADTALSTNDVAPCRLRHLRRTAFDGIGECLAAQIQSRPSPRKVAP